MSLKNSIAIDCLHPASSDVRMKASARSHSSAVVLRIPLLLDADVPPFHCPKKENASNSVQAVTIHTAATGCMLHFGCVMQNALWVFPGKHGELGEGNRENLKQRNGNHNSSDTRVGERKIGVMTVQCSHEIVECCHGNNNGLTLHFCQTTE